MKRTAWCLDVDGVINVWRPPAGGMLIETRPGRTLIHYNPALIQWMKDVPLAQGVQIIWCTTWNYYPDELQGLEATLGIKGKFGFSHHRPQHLCCGDQKMLTVTRALSDYDRVIWTDDEEVTAGLKMFPTIQRAVDEGRLLAIEPTSEYGLHAGHMMQIEEWMKG